MSTAVHSSKVNVPVGNTTNVKSEPDIWAKADQAKFGIIALLFVLIPCLAGIAASASLVDNNMALLVVAGAPAMIVETLILGMASMRSVMISSLISCIVSLIVIAIHYI